MANYYNPYAYFNPYQPYNNVPAQQVAQSNAPAQTMQTNTNSIIWVQGETGAKSYPVAPNTTILLMDSESKKFYIKSADNSGMPLPLRTFDYTEIVKISPTNDFQEKTDKGVEYIKKEDLAAINERIDSIKAAVDGLVAKKAKKKEVTEDE